MTKVKVGDRFQTNEGYEAEVIKYNGSLDVVIKFNDEFNYEKRVEAANLRKGNVKNPYHKSVIGVGFYGHGPHKAKIRGKVQRVYNVWKAMFVRCYSQKELNRHPTYMDCRVDSRWHNFQVFADWFYEQPNHDSVGFDLDKDLLVLGNRVYGPEFCSFVPNSINKLLSDSRGSRGKYPQGVSTHRDGKYYANIQINNKQRCLGSYATPEEAEAVYRYAKQMYVKEQAMKHKDVLHPKVYDNLMNFNLSDLEKSA